MDARGCGTLLAYRVAEDVPAIDVDGSYDPRCQLWIGGTVSASGTGTYSGTQCHTTSGTNTNCGYDCDTQYDNCSDGDIDND